MNPNFQLQIWIMVTALGSGTITGTLGNAPVEDIGLKLGDAVTIQTASARPRSSHASYEPATSGRIRMLRHLITRGWAVVIPASGFASTSRWPRP